MWNTYLTSFARRLNGLQITHLEQTVTQVMLNTGTVFTVGFFNND